MMQGMVGSFIYLIHEYTHTHRHTNVDNLAYFEIMKNNHEKQSTYALLSELECFGGSESTWKMLNSNMLQIQAIEKIWCSGWMAVEMCGMGKTRFTGWMTFHIICVHVCCVFMMHLRK